jgi:hypothetical protein
MLKRNARTHVARPIGCPRNFTKGWELARHTANLSKTSGSLRKPRNLSQATPPPQVGVATLLGLGAMVCETTSRTLGQRPWMNSAGRPSAVPDRHVDMCPK